MARRCCVDSVAMHVIKSDEQEGDIVPCRWCGGYGRYLHHAWRYAEQDDPITRSVRT